MPRLQSMLIRTAAAALALAGAARAEVVTMNDGLRIEGRIIGRTADTITVDAKLGSTRTAITLRMDEIDSIDETPVPDGFYDAEPVPDRAGDHGEVEAGTELYLEVPIIGELGRDVFSEGVRSVLAYARRHRVQHIVFVVDSEGGSLDVGGAIYRLLEANAPHLTYHAIVRNCIGAALAIPLWCDDGFMLAGGRIGGDPTPISELSVKVSPEDEEVMRRQMAQEIAKEAEERGIDGTVIRAMFDPSETLAAWQNDRGHIDTGRWLPEGIDPEKVIFDCKAGEVLVLDRDQALFLTGITPYNGDAAGLGEMLGFDAWEMESDTGQTQMEKAFQKGRKAADSAEAKHAKVVANNIARREQAERAIDHSMQEAASWDPTKGSYGSYASRWNWRGGYRGANSWSPSSRDRWKTRTDAALYYLGNAASAVRSAASLDREAERLGLERTFKPGELNSMMQDINVKANALRANRGNIGP